MLKYFLIALLPFFLACTTATPIEPEPSPPCTAETGGVDYYGDAFYDLSVDSLNAILVTNLDGILKTARGTMTDSGQVCSGTFTGTFYAPLGQAKFDCTGVLYLSGLLKEKINGHCIVFDMVFGTDGFVNTRGYLDFDWENSDDRIYYVGTFCFE